MMPRSLAPRAAAANAPLTPPRTPLRPASLLLRRFPDAAALLASLHSNPACPPPPFLIRLLHAVLSLFLIRLLHVVLRCAPPNPAKSSPNPAQMEPADGDDVEAWCVRPLPCTGLGHAAPAVGRGGVTSTGLGRAAPGMESGGPSTAPWPTISVFARLRAWRPWSRCKTFSLLLHRCTWMRCRVMPIIRLPII